MKTPTAAGHRPLLCLAVAAVLLSACEEADNGNLDIIISSSGAVTSPSDPVTFTVTASNTGNVPIDWGKGSGWCRLSAVVRVAGKDALASSGRGCTGDLVDYYLDPGETWTESFPWGGYIYAEDGSRSLLPGGLYEVRGAAGAKAYSAPLDITVERSG